MNGISTLTDASLTRIAECCPNLKLLNVSAMQSKLTSLFLINIANHCAGLRELRIRPSQDLKEGLAYIKERLPDLHFSIPVATSG